MRNSQIRFLSKAVFALGLFIWTFFAFTVCVFAKDSLSLSADCSEVEAGGTVTVTVHLTGNAIWAYQIDLSANEMFAGDKTLIEDYDGSNSVTVTETFYAVTPGNGEIRAEGSYSDGEELISLKDAAVRVKVTEAEEEAGTEQNAGKEGTGGQAFPGQNLNGGTAPEVPDSQKTTADPTEDGSVKEETKNDGWQNGSASGNEAQSSPEKTETTQKAKGSLVWIIIGILVVLLLAGGCVLAIVRKNRNRK